MIRIDIHTRQISPETKVFVARPGGKYRFFELFVERNFVGPDLPGLALPHFADLSEVEDLEERVKRSYDTRKYIFRGERDIDPPVEELEYYRDRPNNRAISQLLGVVRAYFRTMKAGDLVIVPPAAFRGRAMIGELTGLPNEVASVRPVEYDGKPLDGRNVVWRADIEKNKLPAQTLDALQKPSPLFLVTREAWPSIFRRAYGSYSMPNEYAARFEITSDGFQTVDDFRIQAFFSFVTKNTELVADGAGRVLPLKDAAFASSRIPPELYTNVNSPGGLSLKSSIITPIVISVMLTLAIVVGPEAYAQAEAGMILFGNSQAPANDACTLEVSQQVITQLQLLGYDRWAEACEVARAASERTGISTSVGVEN
ncbi:hypothetical protein [Rhizobium sp. CC-YZS058]|uniref:hypothetical protein n=1 Tax=Rhizobium sp. CC-YZS058 TaxID=3042153 RepID=UPI002B0541FB|nr:hypothetical protein [Rhizobium sp. CC-YZS058]MEA3533249.1 hypothetical protein [Rhizobium sp. CC-YZS058]